MKLRWLAVPVVLGMLLNSRLRAQALRLDPSLGISTLPLYDGVPPGSSAAAKDMPTLTVFAPQAGRGNGSAVVIAPGGAYLMLASNLEGRQVADWFAARGFTAFVLKYRLGGENIYPIPLEDMQQAVRFVRSLSDRYALDGNRIGVVGFSAGGHLAAAASTLWHDGASSIHGAATAGSLSGFSDRPDFAVLGYPWLNAMEPAQGKEITYCGLIHQVTPAQCAAFAKDYTPRLHVTRQTPSTFIYSTTDDTVVPVRASVEYYTAMVEAGAPVEMHLFRTGGHGSGLGAGFASLDQWPVLLEQWLRDQGLLVKDPAPVPSLAR